LVGRVEDRSRVEWLAGADGGGRRRSEGRVERLAGRRLEGRIDRRTDRRPIRRVERWVERWVERRPVEGAWGRIGRPWWSGLVDLGWPAQIRRDAVQVIVLRTMQRILHRILQRTLHRTLHWALQRTVHRPGKAEGRFRVGRRSLVRGLRHGLAVLGERLR